jgi:DNA-binding transcriptional MerR regulator
MKEDQDYSIQDLCDLTGLPRRTIHFYTQQGLLPPPSSAGLGARYTSQHLKRLRLIPLLRQKGLRLDQIRERFQTASDDDLEILVHRRPEPVQAMIAPAIQPRERRRQAYVHYDLPAGMTLVAPSVMNAADRQKLERLLDAAARIFSDAGLPSQPRLDSE